MPSNIYNIYRKNSPFTSRTVYYNAPGVPDLVTVRNRFQTNNLDILGGCDAQLFGGEDYELLNSLDPIETPTIFQFASDDSTCSGYVTSTSNAELEINFFINPIITSIEIYGNTFISAPVVTQTNEFLDDTFPNVIERAQSLVSAINNNTNLNWRYTAYLDPNIPVLVKIRANYPGTQYNFVAPYYVITTPTPAISAVLVTSKDTCRGMLLQNYGYKMFLEIWEVTDANGDPFEWLTDGDVKIISGGLPYKLIATLEQTWNDENLFTFDVSKYFQIDKSITNFLNQGNTFVSYNAQGKEGIKCYFLKWGEMFTGGYDSGFRSITASINNFIINITATSGAIEIGSILTGPGVLFNTRIIADLGGNNYQLDIDNGIIASTAMSLQGNNYPVDDPWNIENIIYTKNYIDISELRWASNGMYNLGILILFNSHPEQWLSVNSDNTNLFNNYQTIKASQDFVWGKLIDQAQVERRYKLRRRVETGIPTGLLDHEYLTVLVNNDGQFSSTVDLRIFTDWTFVDGTTASSTSHFTTLVSTNDFYEADVNFTNVNLAGIESAAGKRVLFFSHTVQIRRDGINWTDLSEPVWYQMDLNVECDKYYKLWWVGSQGTVESFEFEGLASMDLNYEAEYYTKSFKNNLYERNSHITQAITKKPIRRFRLNTGWLTKDQYDWLESLIKTNFVWWKSTYRLDLYFGNGQLLPINYPQFEAVNVVDSSLKIDNDSKLFNLEVVIEYSVEENSQY